MPSPRAHESTEARIRPHLAPDERRGPRIVPPSPADTETIDDILERLDEHLGAMHRLLARARRVAHEARAAEGGPQPTAMTDDQAPPRLVIEGARAGRRSSVRMNGTEVLLHDGVFLFLLRLVHACLRAPGRWSTLGALGIARRGWLTTRARGAFRGVLPPGFQLIEADGRERFRLNPALVVDRVDVHALAEHPDEAVRKLAAAWGS